VVELSLWLWSLFGVLALLLRVVLHIRRTGETGLRGLTGEPGSIEWFAGIGFVAAITIGVLAPVLAASDDVEPIAAFDTTFVHMLGIVLYAVGLLGVLIAQGTMGGSWRIGVDPSERTALVTAGPFSIVRNPIFSAMLATMLGLALIVPSWVAFASLALLLISLELQIRLVEEPYLLRTHGDAYAGYAKRVGRLVPGIGRMACIVLCLVGATAAFAAELRSSVGAEKLILRLPDIGRGYQVGDDTGCGGLGTENAPPSVAEIAIKYRPRHCAIEFERVWRDPTAPAGGAALVESIAFVFPSADGASAALRVGGDLARYVLLDGEGLDPTSEQVVLGEEAASFSGQGRFAIVWRRGAVVAIVHVRSATNSTAKTAALSLANVQEKRIENPTALPKGINDDREVALDDPHLLPVYWLGRRFSPGHGLPRLTLWKSYKKPELDPWLRISALIDYIGGIELRLWKPDNWARFRSSRFGRAESWSSPCAEKRMLQLRRGRAELFAGYSRRTPPAILIPDARAASSCPSRKRDEFVAHVYVRHVVVEVITDSRYESFRALKTVARGLRLRRR
jgi:protein-S-isoprenylcysteine O-methyltransferase Ste14